MTSSNDPPIIAALRRYDAAYERGASLVTDARYEAVRARARTEHPAHPYFAETGRDAGPRARRERLPIVVGSLSKVRPREVHQWMDEVERTTGAQHGWLCLPKFDGQGVLLEYRDGVLARGWTRGRVEDGCSHGQLVTDALRHVQGVRHRLPVTDTMNLSGETVLVRGEVVMHQTIWRAHYAEREDERGRTLKNARNAVAGFLNRETPRPTDLRRCTFIALQAFRHRRGRWIRPASAHREWVALAALGFTVAVNPTRYTPGHYAIARMVRDGHACLRRVLPVHDPRAGIGALAYFERRPTAEEVVERLAHMRAAVDVRLDGLVLQPIDQRAFVEDDEHLTERPAHMRAVKLDAHEQDHLDGHVGEIEWRVSKRGVLKPRVRLRETLDFDGVEVEYAAANNAAHVLRYGLRTGRPLRMVRSGDVIPRVVAVGVGGGRWHPLTVEKRVRVRGSGAIEVRRVASDPVADARVRGTLPTRCPACTTRLRWTSSDTDLYCPNERCAGRHARQTLAFFRVLRVDEVAQGVIEHLMQNGMTTVESILEHATPKRLMQLEGYQERRARAVSEGVASAMRQPLHRIMHASGCFADEQSSLGEVRLRDVVDAVGAGAIERATDTELRRALAGLHGLGPTGLELLLRGLSAWRALWARIGHRHVRDEGPQTLRGVTCAFTGFRSADMERFIEQHGGRVAGVSRKCSVLFCATPGSGKARRADQMKIPVVGQAEAWAWLRRRAHATT